MILAHGGLEYKSELIDVADWPAAQSKFPPGRTNKTQLPVLGDENGELIPESLDIAKEIAERCIPSLIPDTPELREKAEKLFLISDSERTPFGCGYKNFGCINPLLNYFDQEHSEKEIPGYIARLPMTLEYLAGELGKGPFFCGEQLTYCDFAVFHFLDNISTLDGGATLKHIGDKGIHLRAFFEKMRSLPSVAKYISTRPQAGSQAVGMPASIIYNVKKPSELEVVQKAISQL